MPTKYSEENADMTSLISFIKLVEKGPASSLRVDSRLTAHIESHLGILLVGVAADVFQRLLRLAWCKKVGLRQPLYRFLASARVCNTLSNICHSAGAWTRRFYWQREIWRK